MVVVLEVFMLLGAPPGHTTCATLRPDCPQGPQQEDSAQATDDDDDDAGQVRAVGGVRQGVGDHGRPTGRAPVAGGGGGGGGRSPAGPMSWSGHPPEPRDRCTGAHRTAAHGVQQSFSCACTNDRSARAQWGLC